MSALWAEELFVGFFYFEVFLLAQNGGKNRKFYRC
jgi:hypothetical protein